MRKKTTESTTEKRASRKRLPAEETKAAPQKNLEPEQAPDHAPDIDTDTDRRKNITLLMDKLIDKFAVSIDAGGIKPTVGDFLRLVQAQKEMDDEQPREVRIEWVEPENETSSRK